jgi:hypothetical protein
LLKYGCRRQGAVVASPVEDWDGDDGATLGDDASDSEYGRKFIYQAASSDDEEDVRSQPIEKDFDDLGVRVSCPLSICSLGITPQL